MSSRNNHNNSNSVTRLVTTGMGVTITTIKPDNKLSGSVMLGR